MSTTYRKFARRDIAGAHRLSLAAGWPHRVEDWEFVQKLGRGYVAEDGGELVGTVLCWAHDRRHASLGMVIVSPGHQGHGIGRRLMDLALADLGERTVLLNATTQGRKLYESLGFRAIGEVEQHQAAVAQVPVVSLPRGERLRPVGASDATALAALATSASGFSRARTIGRLLAVADAIVLARGDESLGFACFRRFGHGHAIGPVVAPDAARARALVSHWVAMHPGRFVRIDVPGSGGLGGWLDGLGLEKVDTVITMVRGAPPAARDSVRSFALLNQALG